MKLAHYDAAITSSGDSTFAEAAFLKGRDPSGLEADIVSVSVQGGAQTEVAATVAKVSVASEEGDRVTVETLGGRIGVGVHNSDGSKGFNIGGSANFIAGETNINFSDGSSLTLGIGAGVTAEQSRGERDADGDGSIERCEKAGVGPVTVGYCLEQHTTQELKEALLEAAQAASTSAQEWWQRL